MSLFSWNKKHPVALTPQLDYKTKYESSLTLLAEQAKDYAELQGRYEALLHLSTDQGKQAERDAATIQGLQKERDALRDRCEELQRERQTMQERVATQSRQIDTLQQERDNVGALNGKLAAEIAGSSGAYDRLASLAKRALSLLLHPGGGKQAWQDKRAILVADMAELGIREEV